MALVSDWRDLRKAEADLLAVRGVVSAPHAKLRDFLRMVRTFSLFSNSRDAQLHHAPLSEI